MLIGRMYLILLFTKPSDASYPHYHFMIISALFLPSSYHVKVVPRYRFIFRYMACRSVAKPVFVRSLARSLV